MTFGEYIKEKRLEKGITLRGFAEIIDISPVYMCNLEKGRRPAPSEAIMEKIIERLMLNKEERNLLYDLAAREQSAKNPVPKDLNGFLKNNRVIVSALRTAKDLDATDEEWQELNENLNPSRENR